MPPPIKWIGSIHKDKGRNGFRPEAVVIHIMEGTLVGTDSWFNDPKSKVSAHYGIGQNGEIHQYVRDLDTARHAGRVYRPTWKIIKPGINPNLYTIGIEHEGRRDSSWTDDMYRSSAALITSICNRWSISIDQDHIVCHRDIYGRKTCPGSTVDMNKLIRMAQTEALNPRVYNFVERAGKVRARGRLNLRKGAPTTVASIVRSVPAGAELSYDGWTSNGLSVHGNAHWYRIAEGNYCWAEGTEEPVPGVA